MMTLKEFSLLAVASNFTHIGYTLTIRVKYNKAGRFSGWHTTGGDIAKKTGGKLFAFVREGGGKRVAGEHRELVREQITAQMRIWGEPPPPYKPPASWRLH